MDSPKGVDMFRTSSPDELPGLSAYLGEIAGGFCPFIEPSAKEGVTLFSRYELAPSSLENLQAQAFYLGVIHTELFRKNRRKQRTVKGWTLSCENVIFHDSAFVGKGRELLDWPHWLLKALYTKVGVMFGKFWEREESTSRDGRSIPPPPCDFLSIRSSVKPLDGRFFSLAPQLTDEYISSVDTGADILAEAKINRGAFLALRSEEWNEPTSAQCRNLCAEMLESGIFQELKAQRFRRT